MKKELFRTTIVFEVLHDEPLPEHFSLGEIIEETITGHASGDVKTFETVTVSDAEMRQLLVDQRSDPDLFSDEEWE